MGGALADLTRQLPQLLVDAVERLHHLSLGLQLHRVIAWHHLKRVLAHSECLGGISIRQLRLIAQYGPQSLPPGVYIMQPTWSS